MTVKFIIIIEGNFSYKIYDGDQDQAKIAQTWAWTCVIISHLKTTNRTEIKIFIKKNGFKIDRVFSLWIFKYNLQKDTSMPATDHKH